MPAVRRLTRLVFGVSFFLFALFPAWAGSSVQVDTELIGTPIYISGESSRDIPRSVVLSPDGTDAALIGKSGSRVVVEYRGEKSSKYDEVLDAAFTASGKFTYVARKGSNHQFVAEGNAGSKFDSIDKINFSPDGQRYSYVGYRQSDDGGGRTTTLVVDGTEHELNDKILVDFIFSPDSKRFAYVVSLRKDNAFDLFVDDESYKSIKMKRFFTHNDARRYVVFAADSQSVLYAVLTPSADRHSKKTIQMMRDSQPYGNPYGGIKKLFVHPKALVLIAVRPGGDRYSAQHVYVHNGKEIECRPSDTRGRLLDLAISPDGTRIAYGEYTNNGVVVSIDSEEGFEYDSFSSLQFTEDGEDVIYLARKDDETYFIRNDDESDALKMPDGYRFNVWIDVLPDGSCLLYTSPSPRDRTRSRMPSSA